MTSMVKRSGLAFAVGPGLGKARRGDSRKERSWN